MVARTANLIVTSRLLVLQSKRIVLSCAKRRLSGDLDEQATLEIERFESAVARAHAHYNEAVLRLGSPNTAQYRLIAYGSLIVKAERLRASLLNGAGDMSTVDRHEVMSDVGVLDSILESWRGLSRQSMTEAVA